MNESAWTHLGIVTPLFVLLAGIWWDLRKQAKGNDERSEARQVQLSERLTVIETMVKPLWDWWNKTNGK